MTAVVPQATAAPGARVRLTPAEHALVTLELVVAVGAVGTTLTGWIAVQIALIGHLTPLQPALLGVGLAILVLALRSEPEHR